MDEGLVGARVFFLGIRRDDTPRDLGAAATRDGAAVGWGAARADAASRDRSVETDRVGRKLVEGPFTREVGGSGAGA